MLARAVILDDAEAFHSSLLLTAIVEADAISRAIVQLQRCQLLAQAAAHSWLEELESCRQNIADLVEV